MSVFAPEVPNPKYWLHTVDRARRLALCLQAGSTVPELDAELGKTASDLAGARDYIEVWVKFADVVILRETLRRGAALTDPSIIVDPADGPKFARLQQVVSELSIVSLNLGTVAAALCKASKSCDAVEAGDGILSVLKKLELLPPSPPTSESIPAPSGGFMSAQELAKVYDLPADAVRKRLGRWKHKHDGGLD